MRLKYKFLLLSNKYLSQGEFRNKKDGMHTQSEKHKSFIDSIKIDDVSKVREMLLDLRVDPSADNNYAIRWAAEYGRTDVVKVLLLDPRVDPSDYNNYAIRWAAQYGHTDVVKVLLLDSRVNPSDNNNYAIYWAAEYGRTDVVKVLLLDSRVDPSADNNYAIRWAAYYGHTEIVKLLLQDPRVDVSLAIHYSKNSCADILIDDPRYGYNKYQLLYDQHQPHSVEKYKRRKLEAQQSLDGLLHLHSHVPNLKDVSTLVSDYLLKVPLH